MTPLQRNAADPARLGGLRRFAISISAFNLLGHAFFGFEQSWAQPLVGLGTAYATEMALELVDARLTRRPTRFSGGWRNVVDCFLSAHISGLAVAMLLFPSDRLAPIAFAAALAIASKAIVVAKTTGGRRHVLNPSNLGVTLTLLLFPSVGIAPPYHFSENLAGTGGWVLTAVICVTGGLLNARFTHRLPLIGAWVIGFAAQAVVRTGLAGTSLIPALLPMTGVAFVVFSMYMITDPATTPSRPARQMAFGLSVAALYSVLTAAHVVYGLFYALTAVCLARGVGMHVLGVAAARADRAAIRPAGSTPGRVQDTRLNDVQKPICHESSRNVAAASRRYFPRVRQGVRCHRRRSTSIASSATRRRPRDSSRCCGSSREVLRPRCSSRVRAERARISPRR